MSQEELQVELNRRIASLLINELAPRLAKAGIDIKDSPITPEGLRMAALMTFSPSERAHLQ